MHIFISSENNPYHGCRPKVEAHGDPEIDAPLEKLKATTKQFNELFRKCKDIDNQLFNFQYRKATMKQELLKRALLATQEGKNLIEHAKSIAVQLVNDMNTQKS